MKNRFDLTGRVAIITGGAGLLGVEHAKAVVGAGGRPVLLDVDADLLAQAQSEVNREYGANISGVVADVTRRGDLELVLKGVLEEAGRLDILINNAARNPKVEGDSAGHQWSRFENFPVTQFERDMSVGLTGAVIASQVFGAHMAKVRSGVILNIASDLSVIAPDQRIYRRKGVQEDLQPVKPVSYSLVKHGLIGLTKYLATYWAEKGVRVNALSPGGVFNGHSPDFVTRLSSLIPMGRMARADEYREAVLFLISDASSYMTGTNVVVDGGRSVW